MLHYSALSYPQVDGDYFDLSLVPERYTGYSGPNAHRIWRSIYNENCFGLSEMSLMGGKSPALVSLPDSMSEAFGDDDREIDHAEHCLEKRVYYKVISGMLLNLSHTAALTRKPGLHASISTHVCLEFLNQTTGEWVSTLALHHSAELMSSFQAPNLQCFVEKVASHPERLQYIYFNTVVLLRAVSRLGPYLAAYDYCSTGTHEDDQITLDKINKVVNIAHNIGRFDETVLFRGQNANVI